MPIFANPTAIAINNPVLGYGILPSQIGPMSTELAIWLKAKYDLHLLKQQEMQDTEYLELVGQSFQNTNNREWDMRCRLAGTRGYTHALCNEIGDLTQLGLTTAELISQLFLENVEKMQNNPQVTDPDLWTKTEHVLVMGQITIRQAIMLKLLLTALLDAERTNRLELDEAFKSAQTAERLAEEELVRLSKQSAKEQRESGAGAFLDLYADRQSFNMPQAFQAKVFNGGPHGGRHAFVPTAMFGHRARVDLKNLIKYGLVDMKAFIAGLRGRPKHLVRVSKPGTIVVADLTEQGII